MMRSISIGLIYLLFPSFIFAQALEEREKKIAAENKIKTRTQWDYNYVNGVMNKQGMKTGTAIFNTNGDKIEENILNAKGLVTSTETYQYDTKGNRTLYERSGTSGKYKKVSTYDTKSNLTSESGFNGTENFKNNFTYNSSGKVESITYTVNNNIEDKRVYSYSGSTCFIEIYTKGQTLTSKLKLVSDSKGNVTEETLLSVDEKVTSKKNFKYNTTQQVIEEEKNQGGTLNYRLTYVYDTKGNLLSISEETTTIKKYVKKSYSYDSQSNLTEYKWRRSPDDEFNVKKYTYDAKGICLTEHTLYPKTKYEVLTKYEYEFF
jgi:hypothetical protein